MDPSGDESVEAPASHSAARLLECWMRLAVWESWMGIVVYAVGAFGFRLIATAGRGQQVGVLSVLFAVWCGALLLGVAAWLLYELWNAVTPNPITDDFLQLLDESFGADWRSVRRWPWMRLAWAYGFPLAGAALGFWVQRFAIH